jgi:hypothetical protein
MQAGNDFVTRITAASDFLLRVLEPIASADDLGQSNWSGWQGAALMRKGGPARLLGTIYIRQCWTADHINTWPVARRSHWGGWGQFRHAYELARSVYYRFLANLVWTCNSRLAGWIKPGRPFGCLVDDTHSG